MMVERSELRVTAAANLHKELLNDMTKMKELIKELYS